MATFQRDFISLATRACGRGTEAARAAEEAIRNHDLRSAAGVVKAVQDKDEDQRIAETRFLDAVDRALDPWWTR